MTILVTGATGNVGRLVVEQLAGAGERVRAMSRDPRSATFPETVETVAGDLTDPAGLSAALKGVERMYLFPVARTVREVVDVARRAGVRRVVVLSSRAVSAGMDTDFHLPVERAVEESGLEWTHLRAGEFMLNKLWLWGPSIRAESVVHEPFPNVVWCPVHERDIAEVAVTSLIADGHHGRAYDLNGPQFISRREQVKAIAEAIGRDVRLDVVSPGQARDLYRGQGGFAAANADFLLGFADYSGVEADRNAIEHLDLSAFGPRPTAEQVTGRPARTFAHWARDHAKDFIASR